MKSASTINGAMSIQIIMIEQLVGSTARLLHLERYESRLAASTKRA